MTDDTAKHVFISYVRQDSDQVDRLCKLLDKAQIPYWTDRSKLGPGDSWKRKIRDAIRSGSAVFLACFSENQRSKDTSYMNVELTVAVEEYQQRPPSRTWLIPVRFDDVEVEDWDLGAGRSLRDINYADLFGDDYTANAVGLVTTITEVLGGPRPDAATVRASVDEAADTDRPTMLRTLTKSLILEPRKRIELNDLVQAETQRILTELKSPGRFPTSFPAGTEDVDYAVAATAEDYWKLVEPLCWSIQIAARYSESAEQLTPWIRAMTALHSYGNEQVSGSSALIKLRLVPLLACVVTAAVAAVGDERWTNVRALLVDCSVKIRYGDARTEPISESVDFYAPFTDAGQLAPSALAYAADGDTYTVQTALDAMRRDRQNSPLPRRLQPVADWMFEIMKPLFVEQFPGNDAYEEAFEQAETMLGLITQDSITNFKALHPELTWLGGTRWFGRATWRNRHSDSPPVAEFAERLTTDGHLYAPLRAGLFGGQIERAREAANAYAEDFQKVSRNRW
ncbi:MULTISPECIES: toll/interleukin-1 receptor domain-containing protein [unclassified Rhodococcus (in: high G+C Gram-positive bacteria)]|uniref:toll/interleukin-1 receptor domain-containing protein n=1 Tax=unclassified Rhodococcus (in: high G+C Gram-positive bacteria) TaxID=192944 RepID=UPI001F2B9E82|nr:MULTISPECIES: toll/interleukin-1 receptor domain-containing protein [unclassified Rhodococcus (in: high G+C Gram-positive bacteria)]